MTLDVADPRLAPYRSLRERPHARHPKYFIAEGEIAVRRLLSSVHQVQSVLATPTRARTLAEVVPEHVPLLVHDRADLDELLGFEFHRGCVACGVRPPDASGDPSDELSARPRFTVVIASGIADPANLGALIRTSRAFAADLVAADAKGADPFARRSIRASMGHVFTQRVMVVDDPLQWVGQLRIRTAALVLAATTSAAAQPVDAIRGVDKLVLMVGNEGDGLPPALVRVADREITIPIDPGADSLNVGAALAVLLHVLRPYAA